MGLFDSPYMGSLMENNGLASPATGLLGGPSANYLGKTSTGFYSGGGGMDLGGLLGMLKGPNPLVQAGLMAGGELLSGISGLLKGESWGSKKAKEIYNMAQNRIGQSVIHPDQYLADYMRSQAPRWNQDNEAISRRLNLDSGVAQGERMAMMEPGIASFMLNAKQQADVMKSQNDNMLMNLMAQLSRGEMA